MTIRKAAVLFDRNLRPETSGVYVARALSEAIQAEHVPVERWSSLRNGDYDLFLRVDDGLDTPWPTAIGPRCWWAIDTHLGLERCTRLADGCESVFAAQRDGAEALRRAGVASAEWLPLACDPAIHKPHEVAKIHDVCFIGNLADGPRADLVSMIRNQFPSSFVGNRYFDEMARTYSESRIVFNRSVANDVNMRVFEALACGSMLATNDLSGNGMAELFEEGRHLVTYRDGEELGELLEFYLRRGDLRRRIEEQGLEHVRQRHTYRHRVARILEVMERRPISVPASFHSTPIASAETARPAAPVDYFSHGRPELLERIPRDAMTVLDVGCGAGRLGHSIKQRQTARVVGIEKDPAAAGLAKKLLDEVHVGDAETMEFAFAGESFDSIVCGDILEHLANPLAFLLRLRPLLRLTGRLVVSVPNVRHHSVVRSLLEGNWTYESAGLLDQTHLRFFTRREIEKLLFRAGFETLSVAAVRGPGDDEWAKPGDTRVRVGSLQIGPLAPRVAEEFFAYQYLLEARPRAVGNPGLTSIVILTHNQLAHTAACLDSIRMRTDEPWEVIAVDNASIDGTADFLRAWAERDDRIHVVVNDTNRGFPAGCNQGIQLARGRQILLLNNDTVATTGWLTRMLAALDSHSDVGLVGPCSNCVSGEQQVDVDYQELADLDGFAWDFAKRHAGETRETDRLVGFCLLVRREVFDRVGTLDERFGLGCFEDDDFCRRALQAGYRALIAQNAFVHHIGGATFRTAQIDFAALMQRNEVLFRDKWNIPSPAAIKPSLESHWRAAPAPNGEPGLALIARRPRLSLCMIVRDNAATIGPCLESIRPWVDEMIVVDTGSTDATPALAAELGAKVESFPWCDSFSAARNESLRYAQGEWIFWMDSDDVIDAENGRTLRQLADGRHRSDVLGYVMQVHCPNTPDPNDPDLTIVDHVKLFRNRPELRFEGRLHEQILPAIRRVGGEVAFTDIHVVHAGYDHSPAGQRRKRERDFRLLQLELAEQPDHPFTLFNLGMTSNDVGEHEQAIRWLERCLSVSAPGDSHVRKAYSLLCDSLRSIGRDADAAATCERGLDATPDDVELLFRRAWLRHSQGQLSAAADDYRKVLSVRADRHFASRTKGLDGFKARQNLARVLEELGSFAEAVEEWRRVVKEEPQHRPGWVGLGEALLQNGRWDELASLAESLVDAGPFPALGCIFLSRCAEHRGDRAERQRILEDGIRRWPNDPTLLNTWTEWLFQENRLAEAEIPLNRLIELDADDAASWHNLGSVHLSQDRRREAVAAFRRSLRLRPDWPATQDQLRRAMQTTEHEREPAIST